MKRIFADLWVTYLYADFFALRNEYAKRAYCCFEIVHEAESADIVILQSFEELQQLQQMHRDYIEKRKAAGRSVVFIIETFGIKDGRNRRNFTCIIDSQIVCESEKVGEIVSCLLPPHFILPETLCADEPKIICSLDTRMNFLLEG